MKNLKKLSRILLIGIGIYFLIDIIYSLSEAVIYFLTLGLPESFSYIVQMPISMIYYIAFGIVIVFF